MQKPPVLPPKKAPLKRKVVEAEEEDEEEDEEVQKQKEQEYMNRRMPQAIKSYRDLVEQMKKAGATEAVVNDHPSYDLNLGVGGCDVEGVTLTLAEIGDGSGPDAIWYGTNEFHASAWQAAGGPEAGMRLLIFANGMGDMYDANEGGAVDHSTIKCEGYK